MAANPIVAKKGGQPSFSGLIPKLTFTYVAGGAAGNLTLTGIRLNKDFIVQVIGFGLTEGTPNTFSGIIDLTSEFNITADDTIGNPGGTATTAKLLLVIWYQNDLGETVVSPVRN